MPENFARNASSNPDRNSAAFVEIAGRRSTSTARCATPYGPNVMASRRCTKSVNESPNCHAVSRSSVKSDPIRLESISILNLWRSNFGSVEAALQYSAPVSSISFAKSRIRSTADRTSFRRCEYFATMNVASAPRKTPSANSTIPLPSNRHINFRRV